MYKIIILIALLISVTSCGTLSGTKSKIYFDSNPQGAEVIVDGEVLGKTPIELTIKNRKKCTITLHYDGYKDYSRFIDKKISPGAIIADVIAVPPLFVYFMFAGYGFFKPGVLGDTPYSIGIPITLTASCSPLIIDGIFGGFYKNKKLNDKILFYDFETGEVLIIDRE
jgi:hypothetical protein